MSLRFIGRALCRKQSVRAGNYQHEGNDYPVNRVIGLRRWIVAPALALTVLVGGGGCGLDLHDVPMPALISGPTWELSAVFESALNLPVESPVKVDGRIVGQVRSIDVQDFRAVVTMDVLETTLLREGAHAEIRLTSPMGTAFVELVDGPESRPNLADGARLAEDVTTRAPDVADLLSSLSVVVTGGAFADVRTIIRELNVALDSNSPTIRGLLSGLDRAMTDLNAHTPQIDAALDAVDRLSGQLADDMPVLVTAIRDLDPAIRALDSQRGELMQLLRTVRKLGNTSETFINATRDDLLAVLDNTGPVLSTLARSRTNLNRTMRGLIEFGRRTDDASPGDFSNFDLTLLLDPQGLDPVPENPEAPAGQVPLPNLPGIPVLPGLEDLLGGLLDPQSGGRP